LISMICHSRRQLIVLELELEAVYKP